MLYLFVIYKYFKIKYVIYETFNFFFQFKFYKKCLKYCNVIIINLYTYIFLFHNFYQLLLWVKKFNLIFNGHFSSLNVIYYKLLKTPSCMTKYFDKWIKIKFYILCYPSHENMKKNAILGHLNFFWNSLDIINNNIFHYLISKIQKIYFYGVQVYY